MSHTPITPHLVGAIELTVGCGSELEDGVQREIDVRNLVSGVVHKVTHNAPHHSLGGREGRGGEGRGGEGEGAG